MSEPRTALDARVEGEGPWLVLIHGWCGNRAQWAGILPALALRYRVLSFSLPGFGGTDPLPEPDMDAFGAAVAELLDALDVTDAVLVGHSMGGPVAVETAIARPDRIAGIVGLDTISDRAYYGRVPEDEIATRIAAFETDFEQTMIEMVRNITDPATNESIRREIAADMCAAPRDYAIEVKRRLWRWDVEARWPHLPCPARLLNSPFVARLAPPDPMPCLAKVAVDTYPSGHFPMIECPEQIGPFLLQSITRLREYNL